MLTDERVPGRLVPAGQFLAMLVFIAAGFARYNLGGQPGAGAHAALAASVQCGIATGALARTAFGVNVLLAAGAAGAAGTLGLAAALAWPRATLVAATMCTHLAIYGALAVVFGRSLCTGQTPIATAVAQRIHPVLTQRRRAYTRAVTWLWAGYFAAQMAASLPLAVWTAGGLPACRLANAADLPLAVLLFAAELCVRAAWFRGERHASALEMLRVLAPGRRAPAAPGPPA